VTPPRDGSSSYDYEDVASPEEAITLGESLILQCIICGIVLIVVLIVNMTDIAPAVTLRSGISQALSGAHTLDELVIDVRQFGADWLGWEPVEDTVMDMAPRDYDVSYEAIPGDSAESDATISPEEAVSNESALGEDAASNVVTPGDNPSHDIFSTEDDTISFDSTEDDTISFDEEFFHNDNYFNNQPTNLYPAVGEQASNHTVPEPPDTPGLWD